MTSLHAETRTEQPVRRVLPTIQVFANPEAEWLEFQDTNASGLKQAAVLAQTPQAVSTVDSQLMRAQGSVSLLDSLRYVPGFLAQYGDTDVRADWSMIRGFTPYKYLDGMRLPYGLGYGDSRIDAYALERVEVLKGPSSALFGANAPTGILSMYSKLPVANQRNEIGIGVGSGNLRQVQMDVGGKTEDRRFLWRLVGQGRKDGSQIAYVREKRMTLAPSLTFKPNADMAMTVYGLYRHADAPNGGAGTPWLPPEGTILPNPNGVIPVGRFLGEPGYDDFQGRTRHVGYAFNANLNERWALRQRVRHARTDNALRSINQDFRGIRADMRSVGRSVGQTLEDVRAFTTDTQLSGKIDVGSVQHHVMLGIDYRAEATHFSRLSRGRAAALDLFAPAYGSPFTLPTQAYSTRIDTRQTGLYVQDQLRWRAWLVTAGLRHDRVRIQDDSSDVQRSRATSGRLALTHLFENGVAPYVAYSRGFEPVTGKDRENRLFKPSHAAQYEAGVRYQPARQNVSLAANVFTIEQTNRLTADSTASLSDVCGNACQVQTGKARISGMETEIRAALTDRTNVVASYTWTRARITRSNIPGEDGSRIANVPTHQAGLWVDYRLADDVLPGLTLYGGLRYVGSRQWEGLPDASIPAVSLLDAGFRFDMGESFAALRGYELAFNVKNLADKRYVASCYGAQVCYYGEGRSMLASLHYRW